MADIGPNDLPWARHHPHLYSKYRDDKNTVYAAAAKLELGSDDDGREIAGWGVFRRFDRRLQRWFDPDRDKRPLTYHPDQRRWRRDADHAYLRSVGRGQEFALELAHCPEGVERLSDFVGSLGFDTGS